jgi:hypothetical protein
MKMTSPSKATKTMEDQLADFTDRVLEGKTSVIASVADVELRDLEETVLLINRTAPQGTVDEKILRRMQADHILRTRRTSASGQPIWKSQRSRQQAILVVAAIAVLGGILLALPFLTSGNGSMAGTAGLQPQNALPFIILAGVIFLIIWLARRK